MINAIRHGVLLLAALAFTVTAPVQATDKDDKDRSAPTSYQYEIDAAHSQIGFSVTHLAITTVKGFFGDHQTSVELDPADLTTLKASTSIKTASVNTGIEKRDNHLRSDDFFNAEEYPEIKFVSTKVSDIDEEDGTFHLHGDLTIRDVTKPIVLEAQLRGPISAMGSERIAFTAEGEVNRFDYNLKWNKAIETGGLVVAEDVKLVIEVQAKRNLDGTM